MATKRDYYDILGISKDASSQEIKQAYRKLALQYHPDRNKTKEAEQKFKEINESYEILSDPKKHQAYDQFGHAAFSPGGFGAEGPFTRTHRQGPFTYSYTTYGQGQSPFDGIGFDFGGFSDPFEIFESFFGRNSHYSQARTMPRYGLTLDFLEAVKGCEKEVFIDKKKYKLKIPAGVDDGSRIRFKDFYVTIEVRPDKIFKRDGQDVFVEQKISFSQAALGAMISVSTIDGRVKIKIRPGTQSGTMVRLRGRGIPYPHSQQKGNQYVRLLIETPSKLSKRQKELLEEFDKC